VTETEAKIRKELAERTAEAVRGALRDGVLAGGGVALMTCAAKLRQCHPENEDHRAALRILADALEAPHRVIVTNAGYDASTVLARIKRDGGYSGLNVETGEIVDMLEAGVVDAAAVQIAAVRRAVGSAALALTIDVMVHRKKQQEAASLTPGKSNAASK
jgi:chaperonin GroEL